MICKSSPRSSRSLSSVAVISSMRCASSSQTVSNELSVELRLVQRALGKVPVRHVVVGDETLFGVGDGLRRRDDHLIARLPVGGRGAGVGICGLEAVNGAQNFVNVAPEGPRAIAE